jgi:predicted nucleic-acid-binding Zn-ribbon protein
MPRYAGAAVIVKIRPYRLFFLLPVISFIPGMALVPLLPMLGVILMASGMILLSAIYVFIGCPKCGRSPYVRETGNKSPFMIRQYSTPFIQTRCSRCGHEMGQ